MPLRQTAIEGASTLAVSLTRYTLPLRYLGASALSSVATIFCRYDWPLGAFNDSSSFFGLKIPPMVL
ncbi:hypothetical protein F2Q69_00027078 [Brassica cretica]|uniref:Uncharacterized protein n=1 Tax=Brassica cretica TaxID=69181 RepID=A0A8S9Q7Y0_BRACR|nr:hypothetical protein F2Q69_00019839 [Brassica cretica]KAF3586166.1 hypothetical protein F2Q69_00027078 [Brassica cretica]